MEPIEGIWLGGAWTAEAEVLLRHGAYAMRIARVLCGVAVANAILTVIALARWDWWAGLLGIVVSLVILVASWLNIRWCRRLNQAMLDHLDEVRLPPH